MSRTILNINGDARVINPRNGSAVFVDLVSNQSIGGLKIFLNDLECNGNLNIIGDLDCDGNLNIIGDLDCDGNLNIIGDLDCGGNISTTGTINGNLINCSSILTTNNINPYSSNTISSTGIWNYKSGSNVNILLDPISTTQYRLQIYGVSAGSKFLYYSINDVLALYNTSTSSNIWSISSTGIITTTDLITTTSSISGNTITCAGLLTTGSLQSNGATKIGSVNGTINLALEIFHATGSLLTGASFLICRNNNNLDIGGFSQTSLTTIKMQADTAELTGTLYTDKIAPYSGTVINIQPTSSFNFLKNSGANRIVFSPSLNELAVDNIIQIYRISSSTPSDGYLYYNNLGILGAFNSSVSQWTIDINGAGIFTALNVSSAINTNSIAPYSGTVINIQPTSNFNFLKSTTVSRIVLAPSSSSGDIIQIYRTGSDMPVNSFLFFNNSGNFGIFNGTVAKWNIDINGDAILESLNCASDISCDLFIANGISGDTLDLKTGAVSTVLLDGSTTSGYRLQIFGLASGAIFLYYTLTNNLGLYNSSTSTIIWEITQAVNINTTGSISSDTFQAKTTNTYLNKIEMTNEYANPTIGEIDIISQYIGFVHPSNSLASSTKYGFFRTFSDGNVDFDINNISGAVWGTDWSQRLFYTDYTFQCQKSSFVSAYRYQKFTNNSVEIGSISMLTNATVAFNTSSDYRLKQDIVTIKNPLERLMKLQPKNYRYIADVADENCCDCYFDGFIAHEIQEIYPMCVSGIKDDPDQMQSIDYSKLTPICVGSIQELNNKVNSQQLLIDTQYKLIQNLIERLDILEKKNYIDNNSLAISDKVISCTGSIADSIVGSIADSIVGSIADSTIGETGNVEVFSIIPDNLLDL